MLPDAPLPKLFLSWHPFDFSNNRHDAVYSYIFHVNILSHWIWYSVTSHDIFLIKWVINENFVNLISANCVLIIHIFPYFHWFPVVRILDCFDYFLEHFTWITKQLIKPWTQKYFTHLKFSVNEYVFFWVFLIMNFVTFYSEYIDSIVSCVQLIIHHCFTHSPRRDRKDCSTIILYGNFS